MQPTDEQNSAVEKFRTRRPLKISAFAGAGKTTTLQLLAKSRKTAGLYLAFNKAVATEAQAKFPKSVDCRTTHSLAFKAIMPRFGSFAKMSQKLAPKQLAQMQRYDRRSFSPQFALSGDQQAYLVLQTIRQFCQSADKTLASIHMPKYGRLTGIGEEVLAVVANWTVGEARTLWSRMTDKGDDVPLGHDGYLKLRALSAPKFTVDYILLDEAQDTNEVVLGVLRNQDAQIIYVGDRHQQIYEWRGAVNAMERIEGAEEASLTQSFRFGATIAEAASQVLATLGEENRIRGNPSVASVITATGRADAVLTRTNAAVIVELLDALGKGLKPHVVGGTTELKKLLSDVFELKKNKPGSCPEFFGFENWNEVIDHVATEEGQQLRTFVQLVEQHGEKQLWMAVKRAESDEKTADIILSTAHKAKGREWNSVRLASDFMNSSLGPEAGPEVRLFYVAMTRAKTTLIAAPELLQTFTTDAWKKARPKARPEPIKRPSPQAKSEMPRPHQAQRANPTRVTPTQPRGPVREINPPHVLARHPASSSTPVVTSPPPSKGAHPMRDVQKPSLWKKVGRLFGF